MACSVPGTFGSWVSVAPLAPAVIASIRPAWVISVSAETLSAPEMALSTRTDGWCRPRSTWLRYGLDRLVSSASWRSDRLARLRCSRMKAPSASRCASHGSVMAAPPPTVLLSIVRASTGVPGLAREQLLGEVVTTGHDVVRLRQPVGERHVHHGDLRGDGLNGVDHGLDRVEGNLLALKDHRQELVLQFLLSAGGAGAGHCLCL